MTDQGQWITGMLSMARISFETTMRSMDILPQQAEKALELSMSNTKMLQDETRKAFANWLENVNKARQIYVDAVENGLVNLESQMTPTQKSK